MEETNGKKKLIIGIVIGLLIVGLGIGIFFYSKRSATISNITSFEECTKAGYPILETYPKQCQAPDDRIFSETIEIATTTPEEICENTCGDRTCQEVVCLGSGCPCAETPENCPIDCGPKAKPAPIK